MSADSAAVSTFEGISADQMYREHILDHYKNPRNKGKMENALHRHENNPLCGDEVEMYLHIEEDKIKDASFISQGCAISQASASMLTDAIKSKNTNTVAGMTQEDMRELLGIEVTAMRVKCMMLPLKAAKMIIFEYLGHVIEGDGHD